MDREGNREITWKFRATDGPLLTWATLSHPGPHYKPLRVTEPSGKGPAEARAVLPPGTVSGEVSPGLFGVSYVQLSCSCVGYNISLENNILHLG